MNKNLERFLEGLKNDSTFLLIDLEANAPGDWDFENKEKSPVRKNGALFVFNLDAR